MKTGLAQQSCAPTGLAQQSCAPHMELKTHRPPHYYIDNHYYFLTSSIYQKKYLLNIDEKLDFFHNKIHEIASKYNITLNGWIILYNHYHLLFYIPKGQDLIKFIKKLHSDIAIFLNRIDKTPGRKVWHQYWDRCIRSEKDYYTRLNYIHHNCIKHNYTKNMADYKFSSYKTYLDKYGYNWINDCFSTYPIIDFIPECNDDF